MLRSPSSRLLLIFLASVCILHSPAVRAAKFFESCDAALRTAPFKVLDNYLKEQNARANADNHYAIKAKWCFRLNNSQFILIPNISDIYYCDFGSLVGCKSLDVSAPSEFVELAFEAADETSQHKNFAFLKLSYLRHGFASDRYFALFLTKPSEETDYRPFRLVPLASWGNWAYGDGREGPEDDATLCVVGNDVTSDNFDPSYFSPMASTGGAPHVITNSKGQITVEFKITVEDCISRKKTHTKEIYTFRDGNFTKTSTAPKSFKLDDPEKLAIGSDGTVYILDGDNVLAVETPTKLGLVSNIVSDTSTLLEGGVKHIVVYSFSADENGGIHVYFRGINVLNRHFVYSLNKSGRTLYEGPKEALPSSAGTEKYEIGASSFDQKGRLILSCSDGRIRRFEGGKFDVLADYQKSPNAKDKKGDYGWNLSHAFVANDHSVYTFVHDLDETLEKATPSGRWETIASVKDDQFSVQHISQDPEALHTIEEFAVLKDGRVYISDSHKVFIASGGMAVKRFEYKIKGNAKPKGRHILRLDKIKADHIALDNNDNLYILDDIRKIILKVSKDGDASVVYNEYSLKIN